MSEGQDATAAPVPWSGAGRAVPPALAASDQPGAGVALSGIAAADLPQRSRSMPRRQCPPPDQRAWPASIVP